MKVLSSGIDTLELSMDVFWNDTRLFDCLNEIKEKSKEEDNETPSMMEGSQKQDKWIFNVEQEGLSKGNHTIEVRAVAGDKHSLYDEEMVSVKKERGDTFSFNCLPALAIVILVGGTAVYIILQSKKIQ